MRNIYTFEIDKEQIAPLVHNLQSVFSEVQSELLHFAEDLAQIDQGGAGSD